MSSSVCAGIAKLFLDVRTADVTFSVPLAKDSEDTETVLAHKLILSLTSDVFKAMFYGDLANDDIVTVPDTTSDTFRTFLKFVYTGKLEYEDVFDLLYLAKKYMASDLVTALRTYLEQNTNGANIFLALSHGTLLESELLDKMWKDVAEEATIAVCSDYFVQLDNELLLRVLQRNINVDETLLYGRVIAWAKCECARASLELNTSNIREVLGEALYAIRFPMMTMDEFCKGPALEEYLMAEEKLEVILWLQLSKMPVHFSTKKRYQTIFICQRFTGVSQAGYDFDKTVVGFSTDKNCWIHGLGIYGPTASVPFKATALLMDANHVELAGITQEFHPEGNPSVYRLLFNDPLMVQARQRYTACIVFDAKYRTLDGTGGMGNVAIAGAGSTTITFSFKSCVGTIAGATGSTIEEGQVPEILFSVE